MLLLQCCLEYFGGGLHMEAITLGTFTKRERGLEAIYALCLWATFSLQSSQWRGGRHGFLLRLTIKNLCVVLKEHATLRSVKGGCSIGLFVHFMYYSVLCPPL